MEPHSCFVLNFPVILMLTGSIPPSDQRRLQTCSPMGPRGRWRWKRAWVEGCSPSASSTGLPGALVSVLSVTAVCTFVTGTPAHCQDGFPGLCLRRRVPLSGLAGRLFTPCQKCRQWKKVTVQWVRVHWDVRISQRPQVPCPSPRGFCVPTPSTSSEQSWHLIHLASFLVELRGSAVCDSYFKAIVIE